MITPQSYCISLCSTAPLSIRYSPLMFAHTPRDSPNLVDSVLLAAILFRDGFKVTPLHPVLEVLGLDGDPVRSQRFDYGGGVSDGEPGAADSVPLAGFDIPACAAHFAGDLILCPERREWVGAGFVLEHIPAFAHVDPFTGRLG
jgi:hypothetical protein